MRNAGRVLGMAGAGRARAQLLRIDGLTLVLRRYRRGGLISRLVTDTYLYIGLERTRAFREFDLLDQMQREGLPVPVPVAAEIRRSGTRYRASLLMQRLPGDTLAARLDDSMSLDIWRQVGGCIRRFHDAGIWHADLNAHNILFVGGSGDLPGDGTDTVAAHGTCYLIDFDRARRRNPADNRWRQRNLQRLQRSVYKVWPAAESEHVPALAADGWQALLDAYESASGQS